MYAECLIRFARLNQSEAPQTWGLDFAASQHLKARVHSILAGSRKPSGWLIYLRTAFGLTVLAGFLGILPSLAVLISYAHQQNSQPSSADISASRQEMTGVRPIRKVRSMPLPTSKSGAVANLRGAEASQAAQSTVDSTSVETEGIIPVSSGQGPALLRRRASSAAPGNEGKQQIIALEDPGTSGQGGNSKDRADALQQSATGALGAYHQMSGLDRR